MEYVSIGLTLLLFAVTTWLAVRQGTVISQIANLTHGIRGLQEAVATLELQEKLGVIRNRTAKIRSGGDRENSLVDDCIAALALYSYAAEDLRRELVTALRDAVGAVHDSFQGDTEFTRKLRATIQRNLEAMPEAERRISAPKLYAALEFSDSEMQGKSTSGPEGNLPE